MSEAATRFAQSRDEPALRAAAAVRAWRLHRPGTRALERPKAADPHRHLLVLRFGLLNLVAFSFLGAAYAQGLVAHVLSADRTLLSVIIFAVFLAGLGLCARRIWQTGGELDETRLASTRGAPGLSAAGAGVARQGNLADALKLRAMGRIVIVRHIANTLVLLGLIGTVLGFIIALSGVDPERAAEVTSIAPMVSTLIQGMSTALYTTLVGAVLHLWLMANYQLLANGTIKLVASLLEKGETDAGPRAV